MFKKVHSVDKRNLMCEKKQMTHNSTHSVYKQLTANIHTLNIYILYIYIYVFIEREGYVGPQEAKSMADRL